MKYYIGALLLLATFSCNKGNEEAAGGSTDNTIPTSNANVYPYIHAYYQYTNLGGLGYLNINDDYAYPSLGCYTTSKAIKSSIYKSWTEGLIYAPGPATNAQRFFCASSNSHTYIDVRNVDHSRVGLLEQTKSPFLLTGGGKITYGPTSFLYNYEDVWFTYINPADRKYVISSPDVTADVDQKRWVLKSFGEFYMSLPRFKSGGAPVFLEYPIPSTLLTEAPDSIQTWLFETTKEVWIPKGYAVKVGNSYKFQVPQEGIWNIAQKVKGLFKHIQFKTDQGAPVCNAIIRITANSRELASVRTDPDGFALCYLPTGVAMTAEILFDWSSPSLAFSLSIPAFENDAYINLSVPYTSPYVTTISGNMKTCSGTVITQGEVQLLELGKIKGHIVFSAGGGVYKKAFINGPYVNVNYMARPFDVQAGITGRDTSISIKPGLDNVVNFTTCR